MVTVKVAVPGRVWEDFLDPLCSGMQAELGLPQPKRVTAGKGWRAVYEAVPTEVARELADYLYERGDLLLGQSVDDPYDPMEKAMRDTYRAAVKASGKIREAAIKADGAAAAARDKAAAEARRAELMRKAIDAPVIR